jgi:hypothetical protein
MYVMNKAIALPNNINTTSESLFLQTNVISLPEIPLEELPQLNAC